jgi:hypothetical protein
VYPNSSAERLGSLAGLGVTALLVAVLFGGPWLSVALESGTLPSVETAGGGGNAPFLLGVGGTLVVAFVAGTAYPDRTAADEEPSVGDLVMAIVLVPMLAVLAAMLLLLLVPAGGTLLSGAVTEAALQAAVGLLVAVLFSGTVAFVIVVSVGVPALVGAYAGVLVGRTTDGA